MKKVKVYGYDNCRDKADGSMIEIRMHVSPDMEAQVVQKILELEEAKEIKTYSKVENKAE